MQAVILVGGMGTRLRPLTNSMPKPMVQVNGKPFLEFILTLLKKNGFTKVLLLVGYMSEKIVDYFGDGSKFGIKIEYSYEKEPLGTGGGLKQSERLLENKFVLLNGDTYLDLDFKSFIDFSQTMNSLITIAVYDGPEFDDSVFNLKMDDNDRIIEFSQGEVTGNCIGINTGIYYVDKRLLEHIPSGKVSLEMDVLQKLVKDFEIHAYRTKTRFFDIGTFERFLNFKPV